MSICDRTSNNKYFNCPPRMSDGRQFTDYRPNCYVNNLLRYTNRTMSSYEYRQFLINNGEELMKINNLYSSDKTSCGPCNAETIANQTVCAYNQHFGNCTVNNSQGIGITSRAVPKQNMHTPPYKPGLQQQNEINMAQVGSGPKVNKVYEEHMPLHGESPSGFNI
jgi:hypothetical protein